MNKTNFLLILCILGTHTLFSQSASDALRFSRLDRNGGARSIGVMSSLGALGADFGALSTNPAGLAAFRRSELALTPGLYHIENNSRLLDGENGIYTDDLNRFHFNNGYIVAAHTPRNGKWKSANLGIGITQMATYRSKSYWAGNAPGSLTDRFVELGNGFVPDDLDDFEAGLAYEAGAIYLQQNESDIYASDFLLVPDRSALVKKDQSITSSGYQNELQLGFAGNYDHKLYLGATIGIPILNYEESKTYREMDVLDTIPFFNSLSWNENLQSSGTGVNLKLGMIYRVNQRLRVGAAIHTPTAFRITDNYTKEINFNYELNGQDIPLDAKSPDGVFDYRLYTPWRLIGDIGLVLGGGDGTGVDRPSGFLSGEIEWVDYSSASFNFTPEIDNPAFREAERKANQAILESLQDALNVRFGGELAYRIFRFRAGMGFSGTEYATNDTWSRSWSAGIGIRDRNFYIDLGFRRQTREEGYTPYATANAPELLVNTEQIQDLFVMTFGIKL